MSHSSIGHKDISQVIEYLRGCREETPLPSAIPSAPDHMYTDASESIHEAKESEFPIVPVSKSKVKIDAKPRKIRK